MATTALIFKTDNKIQKLLFMTVDKGNGVIDVDIFTADDDFLPVGTPSVGVSEHASDEAYHKSLRHFASENNQFVAEFSTHPEWNPDYVEPINSDYDQVQGDLYQ
jgi:hypothetical protein